MAKRKRAEARRSESLMTNGAAVVTAGQMMLALSEAAACKVGSAFGTG